VFGLTFLPTDIADPDMQTPVFAVMARRAFDAFEAASNRTPSAKELYLQQFPAAPAATLSADLQAALDATAALVDPAAAAVLDDAQTPPPKITNPDQTIPGAAAPTAGPSAGGGGGTGGASGTTVGTAPSPFAQQAKTVATQEWNFFGGQTYDIHGHTTIAGHKEGDAGFFERVGTYWVTGTGIPGRDGRTDIAWSAAFISFVMKTSGAGDRFHYSAQHSVYISRAIHDLAQNNASAGFWGRRLPDLKPKIGDLICWSRQAGIDYDHQDGGNYLGHSDIVVEVDTDRVLVIGGNVGNSVTRRPIPLNAQGFLTPINFSGETLFALMENRIDRSLTV
jgi:hypothetical protein